MVSRLLIVPSSILSPVLVDRREAGRDPRVVMSSAMGYCYLEGKMKKRHAFPGGLELLYRRPGSVLAATLDIDSALGPRSAKRHVSPAVIVTLREPNIEALRIEAPQCFNHRR